MARLPAPATVSAIARAAPPCRMPKYCTVFSLIGISASTDSSSVGRNLIPSVWFMVPTSRELNISHCSFVINLTKSSQREGYFIVIIPYYHLHYYLLPLEGVRRGRNPTFGRVWLDYFITFLLPADDTSAHMP
jgi:hypothetical protein